MDDLTKLEPFMFTVVLGDNSFNSIILVRMINKRSFGFEVNEEERAPVTSGKISCKGFVNASTIASALSILERHYYPQL